MPLVLAFLERRMGSHEDAVDVTSEVFTVAWEKLDPAEPFARAWLFSTAWNKLKDYYRRNKRRTAAMEDLVANVLFADEKLEIGERMALHDALRSLRGREQQMVLLHYWEGLSADEIATVLGCRPGTVWTALSRARAKLRELLGSGRLECGGEGAVDAFR
jgi:RNA polymerase sigma factor (sigma-70 family)